jgi:two-component system copper resistance phosphate regulon response regulator CusR
MHVLIVEDDRDISDTLQMGLEETGFRVDVAHDGLDGEVKARTSEYDLRSCRCSSTSSSC